MTNVDARSTKELAAVFRTSLMEVARRDSRRIRKTRKTRRTVTGERKLNEEKRDFRK